MWFIDRCLKRLADEEDQKLLEPKISYRTRLHILSKFFRRYIWVYIIMLIGVAAITFLSGWDVYHRTEMPQFCNSCHEMAPNFASWEISWHKTVGCADCHVRPGISGWVEAKVGGLRQLVTHVTAKTIDNIHVDEDQKTIINNNCLNCHKASTRLSERDGTVIAHDSHLKAGVKCIECHAGGFAHPKKNDDDKWVTSPVVDAGNCFHCHDGEKNHESKTIFSASDEQSCLSCHPDTRFAQKHGGEDLGCTDCHEEKEDSHYALTQSTHPLDDEKQEY